LQQKIISGEEKQPVNARGLGEFLEMWNRFTLWITERIEQFNFRKARTVFASQFWKAEKLL